MLDIMRASGEKEKAILSKLREADKNDKRHIIKLLDSFNYNGHLCLVFECLERNLRETLNKFGRGVGLSMGGVRLYARQMFLALSLLKKHKIIHADIKPDNIVASKDTKKIKLCDFGSAFPVDECGITEYLVSRFYRAPEIILGAPYDTSIDVWSTAVSLFELYTGRVMFPGKSNNDMLRNIMMTKGKFSVKVLKRGQFVSKHFTDDGKFLVEEIDPVTK
jgi:serine/threonine-protein kinase PRP4